MEIILEPSDIERLKKKYLEERDRRINPEGLGQYRAVDVNHGEYARDPFSEELGHRDAVQRDVDVVVIGGGHGGLLAAVALVKRGIPDFLVLEKAADFGGTWYWNRYPDCRCDIESYIYMPFLDGGGEMPSDKYVRSSAIRENAARVARKYGLYEKSLLHTGVVSMTWDDAAARWVIRTDRSDVIRARFVCLGSGPMSRPKLPGIPGIETFKGKMFHTARWDYDYTGGDETGNLSNLRDKRVAIIGTGATACQIIPRVAADAGHLYVVQRTPAAVNDRNNKPTNPDWWNNLPKNWWYERATNFSTITVGGTVATDMVDDGWTEIFKMFSAAETTFADQAKRLGLSPIDYVDFVLMERIRKKIDETVKDRKTAESLKPYYNFFCKRPWFLDGYYDTFNRENVTLIDTRGKGLDAVTEQALVFDGQEYPVDCIIFASGFEVAVPLDRAGGLDLIGRNAATLETLWRDGLFSLHGMFVHAFPNLCFIGGVRHAAFSWNVTYNLLLQAEHFAWIVKYCQDHGKTSFEVRESAETKWLAELKRASAVDVQFLANCTPGYLNNEGGDVATGIASQGYGAGVIAYKQKLDEWRSHSVEEDMDLRA